jgi:hypothetical protein
MRSLFVILFVVLLAVPSAFAQQPAPEATITLDMDNAAYAILIQTIAKTQQMGWAIVGGPIPGGWTGLLRDVPYEDALDIILPQGWGWEIRGKSIIVRQGVSRRPNQQQPAATPTGPSQSPVRYSLAAAVLPPIYQGGPTWMDLREIEVHRQQAITDALNLADHQYRMAMMPTTFLHPGFLGGFMYGGMKGCATGASGYFKFKYDGPSADRILWEVEFNGQLIGSIDQADSFFNEKWVCVGSYTITARKRGKDGAVTRNYLVSYRELTEITVGDYLFDPDSSTP